MNKPLTMNIKETKMKLATVCNESGLPIAILDLIVQGLYSEIHSISEAHASEEENAYIKSLKDEKSDDKK